MRKFSLFLAAILVTSGGFSQTVDTAPSPLIRDHKIALFDGAAEKEMLTKQQFSDDDYLALYLQTGAAADIGVVRKKIDDYVGSAGHAGGTYKTKDLKKLYKGIHQAFLTRYVDNPAFSQLFSTGNYNCATASALYALVLQRLSVPYHIRETPRHVYIVADPGRANMVFETTAPGMKTYQLTQKFKNQYVDYLVSNKLVTADEASGTNRESVFEKYFYKDDKINRKQLGGLLYYNMAIEAVVKEDYGTAYRNFEKAYRLYPSKRIAYLISLSLANLMVDKVSKVDEKAWVYGLRYWELNRTEQAQELFRGYCATVLKRFLFETPEPHKVHQLYREMLPYIADTAFKKKLQYDYFYETAHHLYIKGRYDSSLAYLDSAYHITPQHLLVQELIAQSVILQNMPVSNVVDTATVLRMEGYLNRYPFLRSNSKVKEFYIIGLAGATARLFQKSRKVPGDRFMKRFIDLMETDLPAIKKMQPYWGVLISEVYIYYIRQRQFKEARAFLMQLKKYVPDNEEVNKRIGYLDDGIY